MKNVKILKIVLVFAVIFTICIPIVSFATNEQSVESSEQEFLTSDKTEACAGDLITISIDLSLIDYDNFKFVLTSKEDLSNITTDVESSLTDNEFTIIANKSEIDLDKIELYYTISEEAENGDEITLTGTIQEYTESSQTDESESSEENAESLEVTITIKIVEETDETDENNEQENENNTKNMETEQMTNTKNSEENQSTAMVLSDVIGNTSQYTISSSSSDTQSSSKGTGSEGTEEETVTYNGESNNYLSSLSVSGYEITPNFAKTCKTYFITVNSDVTSVEINAEAEDENATVSIFGNTNLQEGKNKILISVTAENGNVRIYRIYVTK